MPEGNSVLERSKLAFTEAALINFAFLADLGFKQVKEDTTRVRFESSRVFVNVYHGRRSFELGIEMGRLNQPRDQVDLYNLVVWAGAEKIEGFGQHTVFQVITAEAVKEFVSRLAGLVKKYATPFLQGDDTAYQEARKLRALAWANFEKQVNLSDIREKAETAWHAKDYRQVRKLYGAMANDLSPVEVNRLNYAKHHS
jgi:hypothetical protein